MKYSICIEPLFEKTPFEDRVKIVSEIGFGAIEFWDPAEKDLDRLKDECSKYNMTIAACTVKDFWGNKRLNALVLTGEIEKDKTIKEQKSRIIQSLKEASKIAESENIEIVLESLNSYVDHKDYFLDSSRMGFDILKEVGSDRIKLLFDVYHMQIMEGNIISNIKENIDLIGHFHSAGVPGRHELYSGELNYKNIITAINDSGYKGHFGLEYWPSMDDLKSLRQTKKFLYGG